MCYVGALIAIFVGLRRRSRSGRHDERSAAAVAAVAALSVLLAESSGAPTLFATVPIVTTALLIGAALHNPRRGLSAGADHDLTSALPTSS